MNRIKTPSKWILPILMTAVLVIQAVFMPGVTVWADGTETPIVPVDSGVEIDAINLVLSGEIGLTFHVIVPRQYRGGTMELQFKNEEPISQYINDCPRDDNMRYMATYYLRAIDLSEPVTLTVYDEDGGELARKSCTAEMYANLLLDSDIVAEKEKDIAKKLINYGHYAQLACSEANGWEIGQTYAETTEFSEPVVSTSVFDDYELEWETPGRKIPFSISLRLDYKTGIYLYFSLEEKPTVTVNGEAVSVVESTRAENKYEIYIKGIDALNLEKEYEIAVNDTIFTLSAFTYCQLAVSGGASENLINAMRALYEFYQATVAYWK